MFADKEDCARSIRKTLSLYSDKTDECADILSDLMLKQIEEAKANERLTCMDLFGEVVWFRERLIHLLPKKMRKKLFPALTKLVEDYFAACRAEQNEDDTRWKMKYILLSEKHQMMADANDASSEVDGQMDGQNSFCDIVKIKRGDAGLRPTARAIGVSASTLSRVERGCVASAESFYKISMWLGIEHISAMGNAIHKGKIQRQAIGIHTAKDVYV